MSPASFTPSRRATEERTPSQSRVSPSAANAEGFAAPHRQLERAQRGPLDVTGWLTWFVDAFTQAIDSAEVVLGDVLARADLGRRLASTALNERQRLMMQKLLAGLEGKLTSPRWAALTKCSTDTAQRDLKELLELKLLTRNPGGSKNTSYSLRL